MQSLVVQLCENVWKNPSTSHLCLLRICLIHHYFQEKKNNQLLCLATNTRCCCTVPLFRILLPLWSVRQQRRLSISFHDLSVVTHIFSQVCKSSVNFHVCSGRANFGKRRPCWPVDVYVSFDMAFMCEHGTWFWLLLAAVAALHSSNLVHWDYVLQSWPFLQLH